MRKRGDDSDLDLWKRAVKAVVPLNRRGKAAVRAKPVPPGQAPRSKQAPAAQPSPKPKAAPAPRQVAREAALDRQTARQLQSGRRAIEARIDLHGMRQRDAHAALRKFLHSAQRKGLRHVLVITGKGGGEEETSFYQEERRGVLRGAVPHWLGQSDLASIVVSFAPAPRHLGGEGALYVRLRKPGG